MTNAFVPFFFYCLLSCGVLIQVLPHNLIERAIFFFSSRRRHTRSVSAFLLNRSSDLESSSVPTTLPTAYDVYPLDGRHDGGYYTVKDCVTIDVLPRTPGNNVYVGFMVWSNFTATKCRGLVSLNQVIKEIICLQPLK